MSKNICPFMKKACIEHDCMLYTHVTMVSNPQSGASEDKYGCALAWLPVLQIGQMQSTRGVQAAVESTRNEIIGRQDALNDLVSTPRIRPPDPKTIEGD